MATQLMRPRKLNAVTKAIASTLPGRDSSFITKAIACTFHGSNSSFIWRVKLDGKNAILFGKCVELIPARYENGVQKYTEKLIGVTRGYQKDEADEVRIVAKCETSKKLFGLIGQLKYCTPKKIASVQSVNTAPGMPEVITLKPIELAQSADSIKKCKSDSEINSAKEQKKIALRAQEDKTFFRLLDTVKAEVAAGKDPLVPISYFSRVSKRSRATLYREQGKVIPRFTKIGRNSYLHNSDLVKYTSGKHVLNDGCFVEKSANK